ncbi:MAG TPA: T9SS type A sorting domain-containing protein [Puia sp.]|nr:T9SS type A sorting domain-containing protein [Puia sp.]
MKKNLLSIAMGGLAIVLFSVSTVHAQVKGDPAFTGTISQPLAAPKTSTILSPELKKMSDQYGPHAKIAESVTKPVASSDALAKYMQIKGGNVVVDVTAKGDLASARAELQKLGFKESAVFGRVISGTIAISALSQLESSASIRYAKPAYKPLHVSKPVNFGGTSLRGKPVARPVISQGDTAMRTYVARNKYHVNGKGVKVGVMSDSYNNLGTAQIGVDHGELPGPGNPFNFKKPVQVLKDLDSGGTDEGRAMAEIVHSVAPGSELAFYSADFGQADFASGIVKLANAGCDVIADDVIYFAEPFFQDGIIAQAVDQVKSQGVTYFSSAGNESIRSYESDYRPSTVEILGPGNGTAQNFSGPGDAPRYLEPIYIPPGGSIISSFQWDQSSFSASGVGCQSDFDIYLLDIYGNVVAAGASDNIASGDPIEVFGYFNNTSNHTFYLAILKFAGPDPTRLKYLLYNDALFYLTTPPIPGILSPTLVGHAKADGAIATGAAYYLQTPPYGVDTPVVEGFSSVGGVANYYDVSGNRIAPLVRNKPEIVTPDGVSTSFFGQVIPGASDTFPHFFGTSAAAPHGAALAALMIEAQKLRTITPNQIKGILESHTYDMDNPYTPGFDKGFDFATGYGFVRGEKAVGEVKFPNLYVKNLDVKPLCSSSPGTTRNFDISNPNPFEVSVNWLILGTSQHGSFMLSPGDTTFSVSPYGNAWFPTIAIIDWEDNFGFTRFDLAYSSSATCGKEAVSAINSDQLIAGKESGSLGTATKPGNIAEVYPNPSSNTFRLYLSLAEQQNTDIQLYSADGKVLQTRRVYQPNGVVDIDASGYKAGVYMLKISSPGGFVKTIKLIKQ